MHGRWANQRITAVRAHCGRQPKIQRRQSHPLNPSTGKITLRHGELKHLSMSPMTKVFTVQDPAQASKLKRGDKVRFHA